jgi:ELWxxDGT repeat protein
LIEPRTRIGKAVAHAISLAALLLTLLASSVAHASAPTKLVHVGAFNSTTDLTKVNDVLFFFADDGIHGRALWKIDGTRRWGRGATLVKEIPGAPGGSDPSEVAAVGGELFFAANGQLWKSDGTARGTIPVSDVTATALTDVDGTLFFGGYDETHGSELWKSDGTREGTVIVRDVSPGPAGSSSPYGSEFINVSGTLFFPANDGSHGNELWKSDGTAAGTVLVSDINPGPADSYPYPGYLSLTKVNGKLFFVADDGTLFMTRGWGDGSLYRTKPRIH